MKRKQRIRFDFYLVEMLRAMERILAYTKEISYHEFTSNDLIRDAVIRNFEVMGESVKHVPFNFQRSNRILPWGKMYAMRNFIVHEYFDVDDEILWGIIQQDLHRNANDLARIIERLNFTS